MSTLLRPLKSPNVRCCCRTSRALQSCLHQLTLYFAKARCSDSPRHAECQYTHTLCLLCGLCLHAPSFDLYCVFPSISHVPSLLFPSIPALLCFSCFLTLIITYSAAPSFSFSVFSSLFLLDKAFTSFSLCHVHPHIRPLPTTLLPTSPRPLLTTDSITRIVLCFLAIHPVLFISHCSAVPRVFYLTLSCLSILAHLTS